MPELQTEAIRGVEVLRTGTWNGETYTTRDLDDIVDTYKATRGTYRIAQKIGHEMAQGVFGNLANSVADGMPAFGWYSNLRREGNRLLADVQDVPAKLAPYLKAKTWRNRSSEVGFNYPIAGKRWRRALLAVSLLGAVPPGVEGMADLYTYDGEVPDDAQVHVAFLADDGAPEGKPSDLDAFLRELDSLHEKYSPLIFGRKGAPRARHIYQAYKNELGQTARADLSKEDEMREAVLALLSLKPDADDAALKAALQKATPAQREAVKTLAMNNDTAMALIADKLGLPLETLPEEVVKAVGELAGGGVPAEPGAEPGGEEAMSKNSSLESEVALLKQQVATLATTANDATKRLSEMTAQNALAEAESIYETGIRAGKLVPAEKEHVLALAQRDPEGARKWIEARPRIAALRGERGTSEAPEADVTEPTDEEMRLAKQAGYSTDEAREMVRQLKAHNAGIELPAKDKAADGK